MAIGAIGGLGTFLRQFAAIRDDQARQAEEKRRYEEQKAEEARRYQEQLERANRAEAINRLMTLRQFGGAISPELATEAEQVGMGHLIEKSPATSFVPMTPGGAPMGTMQVPETMRFRQTPQEIAFAEDRERSAATRKSIEEMIAGTTDPTVRQRLQLAMGGVNVSTDELTPTSVKDARAKDLAQFEHGLRMQEIGAQMQGRETPQERYLREIDRSEMIGIAEIAQRADLMDEQKAAAIEMVRRNANLLRQRVQGGQSSTGDPDLDDIKADFESLKSKAPNADARAILRRMAADAAARVQDPAALEKYQRDLLRFALTLQETNATAATTR